MAQRTTRLDLVKPDLDDNYNINVYNSMIDTLDAEMVVGTGVLTIVKLTRSEYDAITTPNASTIYIVMDSGSAEAYIGDIQIGGGGGGGSASNITDDFEVIESGI